MHNFTLGDIVALNNHPYFVKETEILISAEAILLPPVMVVVEILADHRSKSDFEEKTGLEVGNQSQVKCIFYSHKTHKYENNWFMVGQIKKILPKLEENSIAEIVDSEFIISEIRDINTYINLNVILKTWGIEIQKKKSSLSYTSGSIDKSTKITALLSYLPPVMTVIGIKKVDDNKENNFDKKTGLPKRIFSKFLVKCRWFNPLTSSFSEEFFTPESIEGILVADRILVTKLEESICNGKYIQFINKDLNRYNEGNTIGKPLSIIFNHCYYKLSYFDYLTNKVETLDLRHYKDDNFVEKEKYTSKFIPEYNEFEIKTNVEDFLLEEFPEVGDESIKIFRIEYTGLNQITSTRTIIGSKLYYHGTVGTDDTDKKYLRANCCNRNGETRYFKFSRISKIEVLNVFNVIDLT